LRPTQLPRPEGGTPHYTVGAYSPTMLPLELRGLWFLDGRKMALWSERSRVVQRDPRRERVPLNPTQTMAAR